MTDVFISYSSLDEEMARQVASHLQIKGVSVFLAALSLKPGDSWSQKVFDALMSSKWVIYLASRAACESAYVQQELGAALAGQKNIVPIVWDIEPSALPGWMKNKQALVLKSVSIDEIRESVEKIAEKIKKDKMVGLLIAGAVAAALIYAAKK